MNRLWRSLPFFAVVFLLIAVSVAQQTGTAPVTNFPTFLPFNFEAHEFPEGVAVDKVGNVYVSLRFNVIPPWNSFSGQSDQIWKFSPSGERSAMPFFDFKGDGGGAVGLAVDPQGNVYMARSTPYDGEFHNGAVYRIDPLGNGVLLPGTDQIGFPDGLAFDDQGNLYITEAHSFTNPDCGPFGPGGIWVVPKGGTAKLWLRDDLLTGGSALVGCYGIVGRPFGANGIAYYHGNLYVVNTDKGTVVRVPVMPDGSPGAPEVWATLQELYGPGWPIPVAAGDGLTIDVTGNIYVAVASRFAIARISANDPTSQEVIAALLPAAENVPYAPLDFPTSLAFGTGKGGRMSLFITNMGVAGLFASGQWPGPGVVKIDVDIPGLPLP